MFFLTRIIFEVRFHDFVGGFCLEFVDINQRKLVLEPCSQNVNLYLHINFYPNIKYQPVSEFDFLKRSILRKQKYVYPYKKHKSF